MTMRVRNEFAIAVKICLNIVSRYDWTDATHAQVL